MHLLDELLEIALRHGRQLHINVETDSTERGESQEREPIALASFTVILQDRHGTLLDAIRCH